MTMEAISGMGTGIPIRKISPLANLDNKEMMAENPIGISLNTPTKAVVILDAFARYSLNICRARRNLNGEKNRRLGMMIVIG
jgi:hypothetical protein